MFTTKQVHPYVPLSSSEKTSLARRRRVPCGAVGAEVVSSEAPEADGPPVSLDAFCCCCSRLFIALRFWRRAERNNQDNDVIVALSIFYNLKFQ